MATTRQERDFRDYINQKVETTLSDDTLQESIDWIGSELDPDEVFSEKKLKEWAESNGYIKE